MIRTIILDDEILARIGIQSFLENKDDISVMGTFGKAQDALAFLENNPIDIVITDIEMTDMNGLEFIKLVKENEMVDGIII